MKVGLEVSAMVSRQPSGVGNYVANLLSGLQQVAGEKPELDLLYFSNRFQLSVPGQTAQPAGIEIYPYDRLPVRRPKIRGSGVADARPDRRADARAAVE